MSPHAAPYRTALITGATSGLGEGLARHYARAGTTVYATGRRRDRLDALAQDLPGQIVPVVMDVTDTQRTVTQIRQIDAECGGLDLVVANAGIGGQCPVDKLTWERVKPVVDTNVSGALATLTAVLPKMVERGRGHLVGISSLAAFRGLPGSAAYSASKAALSIFLESLRVDLRKTGVSVTCIYPGFVKTELTAKNRHPMPFLMELDDAVREMARGIDARRPVVTFPAPLAAAVRGAYHLPRTLYDLLAARLR
ncbi:MAG: SDR family NAD(P)-dependent oxidoreductase [Deltaproteobacteria bacterium]|nr:MAG: SDR family NAD(P)-dependent oxidoreductase [Deltaproteobacteria bacterium]